MSIIRAILIVFLMEESFVAPTPNGQGRIWGRSGPDHSEKKIAWDDCSRLYSEAWTGGHPLSLTFSMKIVGDNTQEGKLGTAWKWVQSAVGLNDGINSVRLDAYVGVGSSLCSTCPDDLSLKQLMKSMPKGTGWKIHKLSPDGGIRLSGPKSFATSVEKVVDQAALDLQQEGQVACIFVTCHPDEQRSAGSDNRRGAISSNAFCPAEVDFQWSGTAVNPNAGNIVPDGLTETTAMITNAFYVSCVVDAVLLMSFILLTFLVIGQVM